MPSNITKTNLGEYTTNAMRTYGSYVAMERAVADVRDGLKPVQRRIIWAMWEGKNFPGINFHKCAKIVGNVMGLYHPHGSSAIYGALVTMVHERYPLIEGHGNFGGPTDSPAAERYCVTGDTLVATESGLYPIKDLEDKVGSKALSLKGRYSKIVKWIDSGVQESISIETSMGRKLTATPNHPILICVKNNIFEWRQLQDLKVGDRACCISYINSKSYYAGTTPYILDEVISITPAGMQHVYDLTVENTHAFIGNGILCHNTESRLTPFAMEVMKDQEVAPYVDNYSGDRKEPLVLTSRAPMILLNGSEGIGVALSACIPPHNLTEVIKALIFLVRNPTCRLDTILNHIQGPDYGTGVLVSSEEDVKALYETGKGTLSYRCKYHFEEDDGTSLLVITDLAPCFNLGTFLTKMKNLQDQGLIDYCSNVSSSDGMKIIVGFSDPTVLMERVISELTVTESYQFYVVKRTDKELLNSETLFQCNLKDFLQHFIDFRRDVEKDRINLELRKENDKLVRATAILLGIQKLETLYPILHNNKTTNLEELGKGVANALGCSIEQAKIILELKLQQLSRMNEVDQEKKLKDINDEIGLLQADLGNIDEVIIKHFKELLQFETGTRTEIRTKEPKLKFDTSDTIKWILSNGKKVTRLNEEPHKRFVYDHLTTCTKYVTVIFEDNSAHILWSSYFTEGKFKVNIVNVIGDNCEKLVVLDDKGLLVVIEQPQKKSVYQLIRGAVKIVGAVGLAKGESLILIDDKKNETVIPFSALVATRAFVYGKELCEGIVELSKK